MNNKGTWKKGNTPWNKGNLKTITDETLAEKIIDDYINKKLAPKKIAKKYQVSAYSIYNLLKSKNLVKAKGELVKGIARPESVKQAVSLKNKGHAVSDKTRKAVSDSNKRRTPEQRRIQVTKAYLTKKLNNSLNTSEPEEKLYRTLLKENVNKTIYRNYKDSRYPYYCDFYIVEDDLFIELNAHWTHGGKPFDENDIECQRQLVDWQEKAKTSQFYQNAIQTWTVRDVAKRKCAEKNKLNYKVIY